MPVQVATLSTAEQVERVDKIAKWTLFPYSYYSQLDAGVANFPYTGSAVGLNYNYNTIAFKADQNMAISNIQLFANGRVFFPANSGKPTTNFFMAVSYSPTLVLGNTPNPSAAYPIPTPPSDTGNVIMMIATLYAQPGDSANSQFAFFNENEYERFQPYDYNLKFNQFLYLHIGFDNPSIVANTPPFTNFGVIFHMLTTGAKT